MARYSPVKTGSKIVILILLLLLLLVGGVVWFDYLGLIRAKELMAPVTRLVGLDSPEPMEDAGDPLLLDRERLEKQQEALDIRESELDAREEALAAREAETTQLMEALKEKELALEEREKSFNDLLKQYENRKANLRQTSDYFVGMPPQDAVDRLLEMDDQDVIDILRTTQEVADESGNASMVAYWLSLMPAERAAVINRKMLKKPDNDT